VAELKRHVDVDEIEVKEEDVKDQPEPARLGDILGLADASPAVTIPQASSDHGGNPAGIEVRDHATGIGELARSKGATGIDMGGAGHGTDIDPTPQRPAAARRDLND